MIYSILALLGYVFSSFEPPPSSPLADVFLRSLTSLIFFRICQLIISTKNLCYFRIWFFNSAYLFLFVYPILFLPPFSPFHSLSNHGLYPSFHIHIHNSYYHTCKPTYKLPLPPKKHFYNRFLTIGTLLSFWKNKSCYNLFYYLPNLKYLQRILYFFNLFFFSLGLLVYLRTSIFVYNIQNCFFFLKPSLKPVFLTDVE